MTASCNGLNYMPSPQIHTLKPLPPVPQTVTVLGNRAFKEELSQSGVVRWALLQSDGVLTRKGDEDADKTDRGMTM